jgi:hypothetical protein
MVLERSGHTPCGLPSSQVPVRPAFLSKTFKMPPATPILVRLAATTEAGTLSTAMPRAPLPHGSMALANRSTPFLGLRAEHFVTHIQIVGVVPSLSASV